MLTQYYKTRSLLLLGSIVAVAIFWFASRTFAIPDFPDREVSLLAGNSAAEPLFVVAIAYLVSLVAGTIIAGRVRIDAGLATNSVGLAVLSVVGGPVRFDLMYAETAGVFRTLALETILLYLIVGVGWILLRALGRAGFLVDDPERDGLDAADEALTTKLLALTAHTIVTALLVMLLCQSDLKAQALASVFIAGFVASLVAHHLFPVRPSVWYWTGPLIVAVVGYLLASAGSSLWMIGVIGGYAPSLARPAPLDYASAGTLGSLIGYWFSRRWLQQQTEENVQEGGAVNGKLPA